MNDCLCNQHIYNNHVINNINLDEVDKISNDYITSYNKKFDFYYIDYTFRIQLDNDNTVKKEIIHRINTEHINLKSCLLYFIDSCQSRGLNFSKINHMSITILSCMFYMSLKYFINQPTSMLERRMNIIIAKNPRLIKLFNWNKNHPLIRKYSHIPLL